MCSFVALFFVLQKALLDLNIENLSLLFTGVLVEYDEAIADIDSIKSKFDSYLKQQRKRLGTSVSDVECFTQLLFLFVDIRRCLLDLSLCHFLFLFFFLEYHLLGNRYKRIVNFSSLLIRVTVLTQKNRIFCLRKEPISAGSSWVRNTVLHSGWLPFEVTKERLQALLYGSYWTNDWSADVGRGKTRRGIKTHNEKYLQKVW